MWIKMFKLISEKYRKQNEFMYNSDISILSKKHKNYGNSGDRWASIVCKIIRNYDINSMLDYGCGRSALYKSICIKFPEVFNSVEYKEYDPCIPSKNICPGNADLVTCTDVLEHIEPEYLNNVLTHIFSLANKVVFLNISMKKSNRTLSDGRNAHLIVKNKVWWVNKLRKITDWEIKNIKINNPKNFNIAFFNKV